jgi:hypothetical protein
MKLSRAQQFVLETAKAAVSMGGVFQTQDVFPSRDNIDNGRRRILSRLMKNDYAMFMYGLIADDKTQTVRKRPPDAPPPKGYQSNGAPLPERDCAEWIE